MPTLAINKKASFDYEFLEEYEAGLVLLGHEVKSAKSGQASLKGAYVVMKGATGRTSLPEFHLLNARIAAYKQAGELPGYDPERSRKLLLTKNEIKRLLGKFQEKGLTLVPLRLYTKGSLIKLAFALGRGRKKFDKREVIKKREIKRDIQRTLKN